jgi:hypothetical protein
MITMDVIRGRGVGDLEAHPAVVNSIRSFPVSSFLPQAILTQRPSSSVPGLPGVSMDTAIAGLVGVAAGMALIVLAKRRKK